MKQNKSLVLMVTGLVLFVMVLIGIYFFQWVGTSFSDAERAPIVTFVPLIVFSGFFIFIVAAILFAYGFIGVVRN